MFSLVRNEVVENWGVIDGLFDVILCIFIVAIVLYPIPAVDDNELKIMN